MKKPTFSSIVHWILVLFEKFFLKASFFDTSISEEWRNLRDSLFQKSNLCKIQYKVAFLLLTFFLLSNNVAFAQKGKDFKARLAGGSISVKGDVVLIGNSIVNRAATTPVFNPAAGPQNNQLFTGTVTNLSTITSEANVAFDSRGNSDNNNNFFIEYSNVDPGTAADGIFSSSSANLAINQTCKKIKFAGLYWSAIYPTERSTSSGVKYNGSVRSEEYNKIKFKLPGATAAYQDITADEIIMQSNIIKGSPDNTATFFECPYVCFKDVTSLLAGLKDASGAYDANGKYTVANVRATRGKKNGGGAGGWTLVVIYETPTMPSKFISVFDGYYSVDGNTTLDIPVTGYKTLPTLKVNAKIGVAALEGDVGLTGDTFQFRNDIPATGTFTKLFDAVNDKDNFFNATISDNGAILTNRNPASLNSMGFDIDNVVVPNANNAVIPNSASAGTLRLTTSGDGYGAFLATFAVDVIEPNIKLTKKVINAAGTDITNQQVNRGDVLRYVIGFENLGSDKAKNVYIEDYLPNIVFFNPPTSAPTFATLNDVLSLPAGVTVYSYDPAALDPHDNKIKRKIVFKIDDSLVDLSNDQERFITFRVTVPTECKDFSDACSNEVTNIAYSKYTGEQNKGTFGSGSQPPSVACALGDIATNFIGNIDGCLFDSKYTLCGNTVAISGRNGFQNYTWTGPNGFTATGQTINVNKVGDYVVKADPIAPCLKSLTQTITVELYSNTDTDALLKYAANLTPSGPISDRGEIVQCSIDGKKMPHIFLCGAGDHRDMTITNSAVKSVDWYQLTGAACIATAASNNGTCANEDLSCSWTLLQTSNSYSANTAGYFKAVVRYDNGCFNTLYFNVYKNDLNPTATSTNIVCTKPGTMTVAGVPASGYEYSFNVTGYTGVKTYSSGPNANVFSTTTPQNYTASIRQIGVTDGCVFTVSAQIDLLDFKINTTVTQPTCTNVNGSIKVTAPGGGTNYVYTLSKSGLPDQTVGPISATNHTFLNQSPGTYSVNVKTAEGCDATVNNIVINTLQPLTATVGLTKAVTCTDGEITIYPVGGTPFSGTTAYYLYSVNGAASVANPVIPITLPLAPGGVYNILVTDQNNCNANTSITVTATPKPAYTVKKTDILCYGANTGTITFDVTSNSGSYTLAYSIDGGTTYFSNPVFSNLSANTVYSPVLKYTLNGVDCTDISSTVTLTGPSSAVTASAGVSELAGCGDGVTAPKNNGKVRITNPQGGVAPYEYSFDNQATWVTTNEAYKAPGTYTLYIRDKNGCIFPMSGITIDPEPVAPTIVVSPAVFNCDGTANSTVTVTNPNNTSFTYDYYLDNTKNPNTADPKTFLNVPSGSHTISVEYKLQSVPTYSNLLKEDFGNDTFTYTATASPDASSPGINSAFCWERQIDATRCNGNKLFANGEYTVTSSLRNNPYSGWWSPVDHTAGSATGRFLAVDAGTAIPNNAVLYRKTIKDIIPNQPIQVRFFATNLLKVGNAQPDASLTVELQNSAGSALSSSSTGGIPKTDGWVEYNKTINPGNNTTLDFVLRLEVAQVNGIDFAVDDIEVYQLPKSCVTKVDFPFVVDTGKAFAAQVTGFKNVSCAGANDGSITIAAQNFNTTNGFQYSIDNGATWTTSTTSPVTKTGLTAATYSVQIRYDATSTGSCVKTISQPISSPTAVTVTANVTTQATCTTGATITAAGNGGTPAYQYELRQSNGVTVVTGFNTNPVFTNVPAGSYTVFVKDANSCVTAVSANVSVSSPAALTATIDSTSDFCYDTVNQASLKVNVSGGKSPFTYSLDGAVAQNSNTFTNVGVGTHTIVVTDSNNCTDTISNISIAAQLQLTATLTQDLTCSLSASMTTAVTGGYGAPYTYTVSRNGGAATAVSSFPYTTTLSGNYVFTVKDSKSCPATSNTIVVTPKTTPTLTFAKTDITCNNADNGTITVTASNGFTTVYTYAIKLSSASTYTTQTSNQFTGLAAGTYNIKVIDSKGCESAVSNVTIANPTVVAGTISATDLECSTSGTVPAVVTVTGSGGKAPYKYSFNGTSSFTSTNTYSTSAAGPVTAYIQDANGCQIGPLSTTIAAMESFTDITITDSGYDCSTTPAGGHVNIASVPSGVSAPVRFQIVSGPAGYDTATNSDGEFKSLAPGSYIFRATNTKTNCFFEKPYTVNGAPDIVAGGNVISPIKCFGGTGTIQFTVNGAKDRGYDYVIKNAANITIQSANGVSETITTIAVATAQPAGVYTITVTDRKTKCTATYPITLTQPTAAVSISSAVPTKVNCNNDNSQITVTAAGGTPNYSYAAVISGASTPGAGAYGSSNIITVDTNSAANLVWDVYVKDVNGCTSNKYTVTIGQENVPTINKPASQCYTGTPIAITITGTTTGTPSYSIDNVTYGSSPNFNLGVGSYTLYIKDGFGCTKSTSYAVAPQLTLSAAIAPDVACTPNTTINLTATGGTGAYTYQVSSNGGTTYTASTNPYVTATAGNYIFKVTDAATPACSAVSTPVTVATKATVLTLTTTKTDVKCKGDATGTINITPTSGKAPYTYSVTKGAAVVSTTASTTGLTAGTYNIVITDALGCTSASTAVFIAEPASGLTASATAPTTTTCSTSTIVTVTGAGGTAPYTYSINGSGFSSTNILTVNDNGATDQVISYQVKDANGCITVSQNITVKKLNSPTGITFSTPAAITCTATTTSITLTSVAGVAPLAYTIVSGPTINTSGASSGIFTGLVPGNYVFEVKDANGCTTQASKTIDPAAIISVSGVKTDEICFGAIDGTATFTVTGFNTTNNYTVTIKNSLGTSFTGTPNASDKILLTGLAPETYTIVVKDNVTGCSSTPVSVTIAPATKITITGVTASNVNCGQSVSNIVVSATGGVTSYKYAYVIAGSGMPASSAFSTANTTINTGATQSNLSWDVYVMDQNGCTAGPFNIGIIRDASPSLKSPAPTALCFKSPSSTTLDLTTFFNLGTGIHTYTVNGTASGSTYAITGSGTYTIVVKDANGCSATATYSVKPELTLAATRVKDLDCISDANITFVASGGTNTYTIYEVQFNGAGPWTTVTSPYTASVAGNYQFRVTDNAGCTAVSNTITVTAKSTPTFNHNETPISCVGGNNGVINITNPTGIAPFTYLITKGGITVSTTSTASGLSWGTYDILLTDSKGCTATGQIILANPTPLSATVSSSPLACGTNNATVDATISVTSPAGGTGSGYQYSFNGGAFSATSTYSTSISGTVAVAMRDSNNCTQTLTPQVIVALNPPKLDPITGTTLYCSPVTSSTSTVTVKATTGTGVAPLTYTMVSGPVAGNTTATPGEFTDLIAGTYVFNVTDDNGCTASQSYIVKPLVNITGSLVSQIDVKCTGASTGSAKITVSGYTGTYTAALTVGTGTVTPTGSTVDVTGLEDGSYTLTLIDGVTGCTKDVPFTITEPAALTLALTSNKNANCNQPLSKVTVTAGGGKAPYSYAYITTATTPLASDYTLNKNTADLNTTTPTWYVWVKDANSCETALAPVTIAKDTDIAITKPALQCFNGTPFNITLSGTGKAPFIYKVNGTAIPNDIVSGLPVNTATYSVAASGKYTLSITDANNCSATVGYIVEKQLFATATLNKDITCNPATGASVTVKITNGTAPFSYQVYNGATAVGSPVTGIATSTFTESSLLTTAGNYTFVISDSNSVVCSVTTNVIPVTATKTVDGTFVEANPICATDNTGSLTLTATVGDGPFEFSIDNEVTYIKTNLSSYVFSNLTAGTYECFIKDSRGCVKHVQKTLIDPPKVDFTPISVNITCLGNTPGTIEVTAVTGAGGTGGTATVGGTGGVFDYYLSNNFGYTDSFHAANGENHIFSITEYGIYTIKVVDANGCSTSKIVTLASPPNDLTIDVNSFTSDCSTGGKAEVKVSVAIPSASYSFAIATSLTFPYAPPASYQGPDVPGGLISTFSNLIPGVTYTFVVRDNSVGGCYYVKTAQQPVSTLPSLTSTIGTITDVTCTGSSTGSVDFTYNNLNAGTTDVKYQLYDSLTNTTIPGQSGTDNIASLTPPYTHTFSGLAAGKYYIVFTELDGSAVIVCQNSSAIFEIKQSDVELKITASSSKNDNTCSVAGLVTGIAKDGTAPYNYAIAKVGDPQPTSFGSANSFYVDSGDWNVYVKDAFGCIKKSNDVNVGLDPAPSITSATPSGSCYTSTPISVTVVAGATTIGPITYSVDNGAIIGAYSSVSTFNLTPGSYIFNVKDGNGCVASTTTALVINDQLTLSQTDFKILDCKTSPLTNGSVTVTADGGNSTTYSYTITAPATAVGNISGATSGVFTDLDAGNYTFEVSDGTCTATTTATVDVLNKVTPVIASTPPLCVGDNGTVEVTATGGVGSYQYKKGLLGTYSTTNIFSQLASEGTVTYYVKDENECEYPVDATVTDPIPVTIANIATVQMLCGGGNLPTNATITVTATGGTTDYEYSFDGGANYSKNNVLTTTIDGIYNIIVRDSNGCTSGVAVSRTINKLDPPTAFIFSNSQMTCPSLATDVTVVASNGVGPLQYEITSPSSVVYPTTVAVGTPVTFTGLVAGDYMFKVTDSNGCTFEELYTVPILPALQLSEQVVVNVSCKGGSNGNATFTVSNYALPSNYTYTVTSSPALWVSSASNTGISGDVVTLSNLIAGTYSVTITDNTTLCDITKSVTITEPTLDLDITAVASNVNCNNSVSDLMMSPVGGTPVYTYSIVEAGTGAGAYSAVTSIDTATLTNGVTVGTLTTWSVDVYVKDANNCTDFATIIISKDVAPTIIAPAQQCFVGTDIVIDLAPFTTVHTGGTKAYTVDGIDLATSTATFTDAGTYKLGIKDENGCEAFVNYTIEKQLLIDVNLTKDLYCTGSVAATIQVDIKGGKGTYSTQLYSGIAPSGTPVVGAVYTTASFTANISVAGDYYFVTTDSNTPSCSVTSSKLTVTTPVDPSIASTAIINPILCVGGSAIMQVNVNPLTGLAPYTYTVTPPVGAPIVQVSNNIFTNLVAGSYNITVTDAKGCISAIATQVISDPAVLSATDSKSANTTCSVATVITVAGAGGTPTGSGTGYYYNFNNQGYTTSNTFTVNDNGAVQNVSYTVKDANGCTTAPQTVTVNPLSKPTDLTFNPSPIYCVAPNLTSAVVVTANKGVGTLTFKILGTTSATAPALWGPLTTAGFATPASFPGLLPGDYTFQVTDSNGCSYQELFTVKPVVPIQIVGTLVNDIYCNALNGINNSGSAKFTVTGVSSIGNYNVVTNPVLLPVQISKVGNEVTLTGLSAGTYTVTVTDVTTGCTKFDSVTFTEPVAITFSTAATKVYCSKDISQITVSGVAGGTGVYTYAAVKAGASAPIASVYTNNPAISVDTNLTDLSWDVYVKDTNGCILMKNVGIINNAAPTIIVPDQQCFTGGSLSVDLNGIKLSTGQPITTVYGGVKSYTLNGSNLASSIATFTAPGTYVLGIKDDNGCEATVNYTINKQLLATATMTKDLYCTGSVNATIKVDIIDGKAPYSYQMYLGGVATGVPTAVIGTSFTKSVGAAGSYYFVITDSNSPSCSVQTNTVIVNSPTTPTGTAVPTNVSCNGGSNGIIKVTPVNGIAPFTYTLSGPVVNTTGNVTGIYTGLPVGSYSIIVRDAKGCSSLAIPTSIGQPAVVTATAAVTPFGCNTANAPQDAVVTITAAGGTPGYTYSFDGGATYQLSPSFTVNSAKTINYVVHDANGCSTIGAHTAIVLPYTPPTDMDLIASPIYCSTIPAVATVTVNAVTGGVAPFTFEIISPASAVTGPSAPSAVPFGFANLAPNTYVIKVTDANGCSTTKAIVVKEASKIKVTAQLINDVFCKGGATGAIQFTAANYIPAGSYTPSLSPSAGTMTKVGDVVTYTRLPAGNYIFTISDNVSGCSDTFNFTIKEPTIALSSTSVATNINCNNDTATVTVTAVGGTAPYRYAIAKASASAPTIFGSSNQLVVDTNNGADMNWIVYVKDANGCDANNPQVIGLDTNPTISSAVATQCPSSTGTYTITVTASGFSTALQYSVDGVSFQSGNVITVNAAGTYNVTVKDANGCSSIARPVTILQPLTLVAKITKIPTCNTADGEVTLTATGGTIPASYEYSRNGVSYVASNVFTGLAPSTIPYKFYVRDVGTGCVKDVTITIESAAVITGFALTQTPVSCNGGNDGTITATMTTPAAGVNDNPVYMYSLNGGTPQSSNVFTGLTAGTYTVTVTSSRGCSDTKTITFIEPGLITVPAPTVAQFGCTTGSNAMNFATITVNSVTGGSGTYSIYEFRNGAVVVQRGSSNVYTVTDLAGGSYTVTVYDDKGCQGSTSGPVPITPFNAIDKVNVVINNGITCANLENITATAVDASGTAIAGIQYSLVDVSGAIVFPSNTNGVFTGLSVGNYIITAANPTTGCSVQVVHYVFEPNTFDLTIDNVVDVSCLNGTNGSADVTLVDRDSNNGNQAGAFTYTLVDALSNSLPGGTSATAGPISLNGLAAGTYTVTATLTNSPKCSVSKIFTITGPTAALKISETHTAITCVVGNNDGSISATATGGWPGDYEFQLELGTTVIKSWNSVSEFTGLTAGNYTVKVRDSKGCVDQVPVNLVIPTPIAATIAVDKTTLSCFEDTDATITVNQPVTGGSGVYTYTLEATYPDGRVTLNGPQSSNVFTNLGAASYKVIVTDTWTCSAVTNTVVVNEPKIVTASLVGTSIQTCMSPATVTLSATGGTGPYTYSADPNFSTVLGSFVNSTTFSVPYSTVAVDHFYYVKDSKGCVSYASNSTSVVPLEPFDFKFVDDAPYISCFGDNSGEITAVAIGGAGNYTYTLLNSSGAAITPAPLQPTPGYFKGLLYGNYIVEVKSGDCTPIRKAITIIQPASPLNYTAVATDVTCNGNGDGKLVLTASGGTGIIKFALSPDLDKFVEDGTFLNLEVGHYKAIIQDVRGCKFDYEFAINEPNPIDAKVDPLTVKQELCAGENTGEFGIVITGGVGPYSTSLDDPKGTYVPNKVLFTGLSGGNHTVYIQDANTCTFELIVPLDAPVVLNPEAKVSNECVNDLPANKVTVTVDPSNNPDDVTYSLDSTGAPQSSNVFTNLTPGDHFVMVQHKNGCVDATLPFKIDQIDPLAMSIDLGGLNEIVATVTGGSGVYRFSVNGEDIGSNNKYIYFHSGDYTVTVTDSNGCSFSRTKYFEFIDIIIPPIFTPTGDGTNDTWKPTNTENYPDIKFVVYDRYGREVGVFGAGQSWDGKYNGTELPMGDYWYVLKLRHTQDDREFIGHFTLYR